MPRPPATAPSREGPACRERRRRRGIALLVHSTRGGLLEPFFSAPVAHKEGWISDLRASAAIVYGRTPRIVVVLAYRPGITEAEARALGRRVAALTLD